MPNVERLQKYLARAGVASRRASEKLITDGRVTVNGVVADQLGTKVDVDTDVVCFDGRVVSLQPEEHTFMLNKPTGYVTTMSDPQGRPCVASLIPLDDHPSLYPLGRLDRDTSGLLLFSTDGELGHALLHPSHHVDKTYVATVERHPNDAALKKLREGVMLDDGITQPAKVEVLSEFTRRIRGKDLLFADLEITIHEGRNRQVRRMGKAVGHHVAELRRISFGPLSLGDLPEGECRELTDQERKALYQAAGLAC